MPKAIPFIPHRHRVEKHKVDYLRAISDSMDYPYQSEDGRDLAPIQQKLADKCIELSELPYWNFTNCLSLQRRKLYINGNFLSLFFVYSCNNFLCNVRIDKTANGFAGQYISKY